MGQLIERSLDTNSLTMDKSHQNTKLCYLVSFTEWNGKQNAELTSTECDVLAIAGVCLPKYV